MERRLFLKKGLLAMAFSTVSATGLFLHSKSGVLPSVEAQGFLTPLPIPPLLENLLENELSLFSREYNAYFLNKETKPKNIGEPFFLSRSSSKTGILLIHGLMAAPEEVREWAQFLHSRGYTIYAPRLAGHGTSAVDLSTRHYGEWMASVDRGVAILKTCCEKIVIGGFSTGAGLALYQAIQKPHEFDGVISISAPLKFKGFSTNFVKILHAWNKLACKLGMKRLAKIYARNHPDNPHINYHRCPIQGIAEVKTLMKKVDNALTSLRIPSLIIQGKNDPKVDGQSGQKIFRRINHPHAYYKEIDFHLHGIIRGPIARSVFDEVEKFLIYMNL
jgi:esterase/lipase